MDRRVGLAVLLVMPVLVTALAACEGKDNAGPTPSSTAQVERGAGSVKEVALRIEGMT